MRIINKQNQFFKGNIAVDAIAAAMKSAKMNGMKVEIVELCSVWWVIFADAVRAANPEFKFDRDGIQFNNVLVRQGGKDMMQKLEVTFAGRGH